MPQPDTATASATLTVAAMILALATSATAQNKHRQHGAHVHGHGKLNIAIDGRSVAIELEAPGSDIVGFEHAARTKKQKAAVESAKSKLAGPAAMFRLAPDAGCTLVKSGVEVEAKGKDHSEFHATYAFDCAAPDKLKVIELSYFTSFKGAAELAVSIVTPKGQSKLQATRKKPQLDLASLM